ncbi:hypothetical protein ARMGADRAFT_1015316 [Armillaria gallica]|uniref:Uncharacterized protein n=1 Tax=Armillaria gallica TaxID=47427 RepID=A0A2H3D7H5_ARMGA|nr:hypothetical protein ARMGADRAFT_1015316 [Armillaria gallica]
MYEIKSPIAIIRTSRDDTQYYIFNVDTCDLFRFTNTYPTLQHLMEKAECWTGGDGRLNDPIRAYGFRTGHKRSPEVDRGMEHSVSCRGPERT